MFNQFCADASPDFWSMTQLQIWTCKWMNGHAQRGSFDFKHKFWHLALLSVHFKEIRDKAWMLISDSEARTNFHWVTQSVFFEAATLHAMHWKIQTMKSNMFFSVNWWNSVVKFRTQQSMDLAGEPPINNLVWSSWDSRARTRPWHSLERALGSQIDKDLMQWVWLHHHCPLLE